MCNCENVKEKKMIGIDGGGTKTEFVLVSEQGAVLRRIKLSRSNPNDIGIEKCCETLAAGIDDLLAAEMPVCSLFAGVAGCATGNNAQKVEAFLKNRYPGIEIAVDTDGVNILSCNINSTDCMALICGTGSVLFVREKGIQYRIGGWGYLFDEAGSAYDIGRDAIRAVLAEKDGLGPKTQLTPLLMAELKSDIWSALGEIYQRGKAYIASLAPIVCHAYDQGDKVAEDILRKNAAHLALLISTAMENYDCGRQVVACGGLIENYKDMLLPMMEELMTSKVEFIVPDVPPVFGACVESCRRSNLVLDQNFYENFCKTYWANG